MKPAVGLRTPPTLLRRRRGPPRDAFFMPDGLLINAYYHTVDRVYTSFPEIVFAGVKAT